MEATLVFWQNIALFTMLNAIVALGFYVTLSSGMLSLAHASIAGIAAYGSAVLTTNFDWPFFAAVAVGIALGSAVGFFLGFVTVRMSLLVSSLVTLGFGETMSIVALNVPYLGGANSFLGIPLHTTLPMVLLAFVGVVYVTVRFDRSRMGLAARAVRDNRIAAAASGIDVTWVRALTFGLGGGLAAVAGTLSAHYTLVVSPGDLGFWPSFYIQVYVILGGSYTPAGPILGAVLLTPMTQILRFAGPYRFAVYGLVIVLALLIRPRGLLVRTPEGEEPPWRKALAAIRTILPPLRTPRPKEGGPPGASAGETQSEE